MRESSKNLLAQLPKVKGSLRRDVPLARYTWFRVGGPADVLFVPADSADLIEFLGGCPPNIPICVIGVGSNLLIRDGGIRGVVIRLGRSFAKINIGDECRITAGAGALGPKLARLAAKGGIRGLEFLSGVPGTVGGAIRMNAGAYGNEVADVLVSASVVSRAGSLARLSARDLRLRYRGSSIPSDSIVLDASFYGEKDVVEDILRRIEEINKNRDISQPIRDRTGGSTFANPFERSAWELIESAGCRGLRIGKAMVSPKHCNFLINTGGATSADIEKLGEELRRRVREQSGIELRWEIQRIGSAEIPTEEPT
ncbi:MAG: UDP-N-acetylenolpyruvoylglucosamine reductase [Rhodospirillaceae bacterium]|nr:UDP-N-acetylenolpyruvoylglucosamine reductase [Rhodospirillaceae bacterium]|tara:strand:- start:2102 stop:3037 length:936 start_codon:yes stop_codon:yes gene_type:complete